MSSIDALVSALQQFEGTLVFISHDVYFIRALANKVIHVAAGQLTHYAGDYEFYLYKTRSVSARAALTASGTGPATAAKAKPAAAKPAAVESEQRQQEHRQRQARAAEQKKLQPLVNKLEREIEALEKRQATITAELEGAEAWQAGGRSTDLSRELRANAERLAGLSKEWEAVATRLAAVETR